MPGYTGEVSEALGHASRYVDNGSAGAGTSTFDLSAGTVHKFVGTAATRTIAAPTDPGYPSGTELTLIIGNTSGGALTLTWNAVFKTPSGTGPATGTTRVYKFVKDGVNWRSIAEGDQTT